MHIFSLLPQLFFLAPFGYVLIRGTLAALLLIAVKEQWGARVTILLRSLMAAEVLTAISLALGAWAQLGAILAVIIFILWFVFPQTRPYPTSTILLAAVLSIVIFISGAGLLAVDWWPL